MSRVRAAWRGLRLALHVGYALALALALKLDFSGRLRGEQLMHHWTARLLRILGVRLQQRGTPASGPRVTVANHISWLDIPLIGACEPTRFVSKAEVARWPLAGWLADAAGTFYIRRGQGGARPLLQRLVPHLRAGGSVVVFPEGTTTSGQQVLPFYPRLFAAALESGCPVQPVAIRYLGDTGARLAPFVGDDDLVSHLLRLLQAPELVAELVYGEPISPQGLDREQLCTLAYRAVCSALGEGQGELSLAPAALAA